LNIENLEKLSPISISTVDQVEPLIEALRSRLDSLGFGEDILLISTRQINAVEAANHAIEEAVDPLSDGELELFSYHIQDAIGHIGTLTHPYENDEVLDKMFGEFCLGK
jgi:tRNA modification GTPase